MRVTVISIVMSALAKVPNGFERGLEKLKVRGRIDSIQTAALLTSVRILRRVLET